MRGMRLRRLITVVGAACAIALASAGPAWAGTSNLYLRPGQQGLQATSFENKCDEVPAQFKKPGFDTWVFVLPDEAATLDSLHLTFTNTAGGTVIIDIPGTSYPSGFTRNGTDKAFVELPAGWTLVAGDGVGQDLSKGDREPFNVTHVCLGGGSGRLSNQASSTSPTPTSGAGAASDGGSADGASGSGGGSGGSLPITGTAVGGLVVLGLGLVAAGVTLLMLRRRREAVKFHA